MKDIIVAVDFSESSVNSIEHALTIAEKAHSNVTMLWVNKHGTTKTLIGDKVDEQDSEVISKFEEFIEKYKSYLSTSKLSYKIRNGKVYSEIINETKELKAELLVIGTHGSSGFEQFWIGSDANKIIANTDCPVITIREGIDIGRNLDRIALPIDFSMETLQKVGITIKMADYFNAEVHVLEMFTTDGRFDQYKVSGYADMAEKHLNRFGIKFVRESVRNDNPTKGAIEYAEKIDANLMVIMTDQVKSTKNLWFGSYAQQMVNQSPIPVLSVSSKDVYSIK